MAEPTFDFINDRFFDQRIKVQKVINQQHVQEFGDLIVPGAAVGIVLNPLTGSLSLGGVDVTLSLRLAGSPTLTSATVLPDKVVNQGTVPVTLVATTLAGVVTILDGIFTIPWQGILDTPGAAPGDTVQKHDVQLEGLIVTFFLIAGSTTAVNLVLKAILDMCVIVTSERILKVNAAEIFC